MIYSFHNASFRDKDTGLYNEAYFMEVFYREWHRMLREHHAVSILVVHPEVDITNAHGLEQYIQLAGVLSNCTYRATDLVSRFNNSEFVIGLFDLAPQGTEAVIERILDNIAQDKDTILHGARNTFIGGVHVYPTQDVDINEVFKAAVSIRQLDAKASDGQRQYELKHHMVN